jgi:cobalt-zinc-cadmium efflux system outer membrane protein
MLRFMLSLGRKQWLVYSSILCMSVLPDRVFAITPNEALALVTVHHPDVVQARQNVEIVRASRTIAEARPNPTLTLSTTNSRPRHYGTTSQDPIIRLDQPIERGGKRQLRLENADAQLKVAEHTLMDVTHTAETNVMLALADLWVATQRLDLLQRTEQSLQHTMRLTQKRLKAGDVASVDVQRLAIDVSRAQFDTQQAQLEVQRVQTMLVQLLGGMAPPLTVEYAPQLDDPERILTAQGLNRAVLIDARSDVQALSAQIVSAEKQLALAQAQRTRDISVGVQRERSPENSFNGTLFGVGVSIPLLVGNDYRGDIQQADQTLRLNQQQLALLKTQIQIDLLAAEQTWQMQWQRWQTTQGLLQSGQKTLQAVEFAYQNGAANLTDLLDARRQSLKVQDDVLQSQLQFWKAMLIWRAILHVPFDQPLQF